MQHLKNKKIVKNATLKKIEKLKNNKLNKNFKIIKKQLNKNKIRLVSHGV